jgi:hypothetical protein
VLAGLLAPLPKLKPPNGVLEPDVMIALQQSLNIAKNTNFLNNNRKLTKINLEDATKR